jgi:hypothetical protein
MDLLIDGLFAKILGGEHIDSFPADWQWNAHPRYTADYKRLLLNELRSDSCTAGETCINRANSNFEEFFMALAFEDVNNVIEAAVHQNALAASKLGTSLSEQDISSIEPVACALGGCFEDSALTDARAQILQEQGGAFVSWEGDLELEDDLYTALLRSCEGILSKCGFTVDKLGLHTLFAVIKFQRHPNNEQAHLKWSYLLEEKVVRYFQFSEGRFDFVNAASHLTKSTRNTPNEPSAASSTMHTEADGAATSVGTAEGARTLIIVFSSIGGGVIRPEFKGTLRAAAGMCAAGDQSIPLFDALHVMDPGLSWFMQVCGVCVCACVCVCAWACACMWVCRDLD